MRVSVRNRLYMFHVVFFIIDLAILVVFAGPSSYIIMGLCVHTLN